MFSRLSRLPIRRCLHTSSAPKASGSLHRGARAAFGASAVTAAYMTWRLMDESNQIALDSPTTNTSTQKPLATSPPKASRPTEPPSESTATTSPSEFAPDTPSGSIDESPKEGESESSTEGEGASGGAFNPVTGEINWDCPCLGGMAYGPCGEEFREAFSCFVYSDAEPKGINCVEKFQNMQNCFRAHPEVYADEIMDDDEEEAVPSPADNIPLHEQSNEDELNGTTSDLDTHQKSRIETAHATNDSS
ncbi:hypothetical protein CPB84DRAFT_1825573 [Gymnopilus junonius]|uniref:Mitochondrial intermembrane space import and assembly protein 40 n=1 Tax=Gymnopilus junonius TaxID=109634 RepID=A0A9P5NMP2_GYMJU|nr:hypothetical protein CPB84DRAFT_1825573 [Gymnopilus junonius]